MVTIPEAVLLGIVQGITEWLPVSSSGHLVIVQELLNIQAPVVFDVFLHIGTLLVALLVFWDDVKKIVLSLVIQQYKQYRPMLYMLILGSVVTAVIGFTFKTAFLALYTNLFAVGVGLLITTTLLLWTKRSISVRSAGYIDALLIGFAQGIAIIPGVSRSGATISVGLLRGLEKEEVMRFSFLLMMPAVLGALLLLLPESMDQGLGASAIVGTIVSIFVGYISLKVLMSLVRRNSFYKFGWYTGTVGILLVAIQLAAL